MVRVYRVYCVFFGGCKVRDTRLSLGVSIIRLILWWGLFGVPIFMSGELPYPGISNIKVHGRQILHVLG